MKRPRLLAAALPLLLVLGACSSDDPEDPTTEAATTTPSASESATPSSPTPGQDIPSPSASSTPTPTPSQPAGPELVVTIKGDQVKPNSQEIDLEVGETLIIRFDTDRDGELHVHSTPGQYVEFEAGTSTKKLVIKAPGVVEVEEHDTSHVVASLEVR
ncbi:hypothetical protein [Nocardioides halotolerans]|jgi:hypothetical protein|uniref:hypothetical protein n=1 Tax=Nocardioides halotolerans TaxID=433660 RepID=UPI0006884029|nr:hypothetical protein [Nocardioides halotolerans]